MIDLHNHLLPAVDDGAVDLAESAAAIGRMYEQGVRTIVVTPHVRASVLLRPAEAGKLVERLDESWRSFQAMCTESFPDLSIHHGTELMLDHPSPALQLAWLRLAGTRFVLVEFPGMMIPPRALDALSLIVDGGYVPVVAHPERYRNASAEGTEFQAWKDAGARLQVNCGSLLGYYGTDASRRAWQLLERGSIDILASDYHARGRFPLQECERVLRDEDAEAQSELLLRTNPARLIQDLDPLEVPPAATHPSPWKRLVRRGKFWT